MLVLLGFLVLGIVLVGLLKVVSMIIAESCLTSREELSSYECGFEHHNLSRVPFSFRYFLLTLLFLLFDLEILLLLGVVFQFTFSSYYFLSGLACLFFILFLFFGWFYEYAVGSLDWSSL